MALRRLAAPRSLPDEAVHAARKALKKARAALRLLRDGIDETFYRRENSALRDAGRLLSPMREAQVSLSTFESLCASHADALDDSDLAAVRKKLQVQRNAARRAMREEKTGLQACVRMLRNCRDRARQAELSSCKATAIATGLQRIYRNGRRALAEARACGHQEALHEWRKQVKYLANAGAALSATGDTELARLTTQAARLADALGDEHDLSVLHEFIARAGATEDRGLRRMLKLIGRRRAQLQGRAFRLGGAIYDGKLPGIMNAKHASRRPVAPQKRRSPGAVR